jgi:hypothetical protein
MSKTRPDTLFTYRGLRFHLFEWMAGRGRTLRPLWTVYISEHDYHPVDNFPGVQGACTSKEGYSRETSAEIALERFNRRLIDDGQIPLMFKEGDHADRTGDAAGS